MLAVFAMALGVLVQEGPEPVESLPVPDQASWISFTPARDVVVFGTHTAGWDGHSVLMTQRVAGFWSAPQPVEIDGAAWPVQMRAMRFSPDGEQVIFSSAPLPGESRTDWDLWTARWHQGRLVAAWRLPDPVNTRHDDFHASLAANGVIYFASRRRGGAGEADLYRAVPDLSVGWRVERLEALSTAQSEADIFVTADESHVVFSRMAGVDGLGGDDLHMSERAASGWSEPVNLGATINSDAHEFGAWIGAGDDRLYFTAERDGRFAIHSIAWPLDIAEEASN